MGILSWVILGLIAGALAKFIMPGNQSSGWVITIVLGIVGAVVGGFIGSALGFGDVNGFNFRSLIIATVGALVVLGIYSMVAKGNRA